MASTLKLCLMTHVEDGFEPNEYEVGTWENWGYLATMIGNATGAHNQARGAKWSVQFGRDPLDTSFSTAGEDNYNPPTSLHNILDNGGNFWVQTHSTTPEHLRSTHACVMTAYEWENSVNNPYSDQASVHVSGRSGGGGVGVDWVSITVAQGIRRANSSTMFLNGMVPRCLRPYCFSDDDLEKLYQHDAAPGPLTSDVATMRTRPFWAQASSSWYSQIDCTFPHLDFVSSLMVIPQASRWSFDDQVEKRSAYEGSKDMTVADLDGVLTAIWTTFMLMTMNQSSISNVWYAHYKPDYADNTDYTKTLACWVDSVNELMTVYGTTPFAEWKNMNEIADIFSNTSSMYW